MSQPLQRSVPFHVVALLAVLTIPLDSQATVVPNEIQEPGTQPRETSLESISKCDNCHAGYDPTVEPARLWSGSAMAQAGRDPLFWATVAVAEQDFPGVGDLCIRCHSPEGWTAGRSTPTDGSALAAADGDGVSCDLCHQLTNPDDSEHLGVQNAPFVANDGGTPPQGYHGGGMYVLYGGAAKLGPYADPAAPHQALPSAYHRSSALCGTCHDVSNPAVGDLAPNQGSPVPLAPGTFSGVLGGPLAQKAAFNHFPFAYGVVERTYSEHVASAFEETRIADFANLPVELQAGSIQRARDAAVAADPSGDYVDGTPRFFTCQTCHLPPVTGRGANKHHVPVRSDLPLHDMTGGNTWLPAALQYLDDRGRLVLGGGLSATQSATLVEGEQRARQNLRDAASLQVNGDTLRVVNLTGHKLISGYPEGRRMWLDVKWLDGFGNPIREDGAYGMFSVELEGSPLQVASILDLHSPNLRIYEAHAGVTQEWAAALLNLGYDAGLPLAFHRRTGAVLQTLGSVASAAPGSAQQSFHFALNNTLLSDNRIPPFGMSYDEALLRNVRPVPETQYGDPGSGGTYAYWDSVPLNPPTGAASATIDLLYQTTSWEYVQFLVLAGDDSVSFLSRTDDDLLEAWLQTGMSAPEVMASATWTASDPVPKLRKARSTPIPVTR